MGWPRFSEAASRSIHRAQELAQARGDGEIGVAHLLLGLLHDQDTQALLVLGRAGVRCDELEAQVIALMGPAKGRNVGDMAADDEAKRALDLAFTEGGRNLNYLGTEHLLLGLAGASDSVAGRALACQGVDREGLRVALLQLLREERFAAGEESLLDGLRCSRTQGMPEVDRLLRAVAAQGGPRDGSGGKMWMRFTESARKLVFDAQETAIARKDSEVDTGYLLLGLLQNEASFAIRLLDRAGVRRDELEKQAEALLGPPHIKPDVDISLTPAAKRSIDLAYEEARRLNNNYIGTEHLLLGMLGEGQGVAARALACQDATLHGLRTLVEQMQKEGRGGVASDDAAGNPVDPV
ncbi:MAG: Clp protease N-terminal domain-containing protein [Actinomycetota bacterium]